MVSLTANHADGSTDTIDETVGWSRRREIGAMRRVTIDVERSDARGANLEPKSDSIDLGSIDAVRLVDVESGGSTFRLIGYSFEWDANTVAPTPGGDLREGDDQTLITNLINEVPSWTAGTIGNFTGALSFIHNHAHIHEALRRIEKNVPGELQWRDEGTVDYVSDLGTDKTGSVTLSAANGNIERDIRITNRGRELDGTHVRVLGAHEGEAQLYANLVPSDDGASYDNRVDYTTSRWSPGDTRDWDVYVNKDVTDQATLDEEAAAIGAEITEDLVEAETTVPNSVGLSVGDWIHVEKTDADLDRDMRVHRITTKAGGMNDTASGASVVDEVLLSTRTTMRQDDSDTLADVKRFTTGYQGASVVIQGGGSRQPVASGVNAEIPFYYPDIVFENEAILHVRGLPYRAYSQGAKSGGSTTTTTQNNADFSNIADSEDSLSTTTVSGWTTIADFSPLSTTSQVFVFASLVTQSGDGTVVMDYRLRNDSEGTYVPDSSGFETTLFEGDRRGLWLVEATDAGGDTLQLQMQTTGSGSATPVGKVWWVATGPHTHEVSISDHTHPVDPGVLEFGSDTPTGVDVIVGGSTVASDIGSGTFETTVDISGELTKDAWNMVELTSDDLGHIQATISIDGYKKVGAK